MGQHQFNEFKWASAHLDILDPSEREVTRIAMLRENYPELIHWGSLALNEAWGWYSEDCWLVSMIDIEERDLWFLGYLYQVEQGRSVGEWNGDTEFAALGAKILNLNK